MALKNNFWIGKILPRIALMFVPLPKNTFCSIDVTSKCNLRCKHCYFYSYEQTEKKELTDDEWLTKIRQMQSGRHPFYNCTWVGGEPLLRKSLIEKGIKLFKSNKVVTNGTIPLPVWNDVSFHISVDGTEKYHDEIRGQGIYTKLKANILKSDPEKQKIFLACCLNRKNVDCFEDLLKEWQNIPNIRGILVDFFTPIKGVNEDIWIPFNERDKILDKLIILKQKYGKLISLPPKTFHLMKTKHKDSAIGKNCVFIKNGISLDAFGNVKKPCVIGEKADCSKCGCVVPFSVKAWKHPANLLREIWQSF